MPHRSILHAYLDPAESLDQVLFGLIMVLTILAGAELVSSKEALDAHQLVVAALGCNLAWGVIDAVFLILDTVFHRSKRARFYRGLRSAASEAEALAALQAEFGLEDEPLDVAPEDRVQLYRTILALNARAAPARVGVKRRDIVSAGIVFILVAATALPGAVPFLLLDDPWVALRVSEAILIMLLFLAGHWWGHYTDASSLKCAVIVTSMGVSMVSVAVLLGG
jgi:hypothetical protein